MARLDPDGAFRGAEVGPRAAADGDGQAGPGRAEREYRRCALFRVQRIGDRAGELPPVAALSGDLLKQVKQVVGGMALLQAAEQDQVAVPGTVPLMPGIAPAWSSSQTSSPSGIAVTRPKSVGQSFSQRHCMTKWYTNSQPTPSTATAARITKVSWYTTESGAGIDSSGPMMRVTSPPTTASSTSRVWIRPPRVGSTFCLLFDLMSAATRPWPRARGAGLGPAAGLARAACYVPT